LRRFGRLIPWRLLYFRIRRRFGRFVRIGG
jgi:hypothetical protein